ncbi:MAG TPA: response regulator transcription factor [Thermoanaerobaculia bacterium]|nr:response regulator transcription factor [Thermoanaerobaculia bacterium]
MGPIALVEDDAALARTLRTSLESEGFRIEWLSDADSASALGETLFALALIDLEFRHASALALCRKASSLQPVIAFTGHADVETRIDALDSGAADCLVRPFNIRELAIRMRNVLGRTAAPADYDDGELSFSLDAMTVRVHGTDHALTHGESDILGILLAHTPMPVPLDQIAQLLPVEDRVQPGTIESRIKSLRRKLGADRIVTRRGWGVQFVTKVTGAT